MRNIFFITKQLAWSIEWCIQLNDEDLSNKLRLTLFFRSEGDILLGQGVRVKGDGTVEAHLGNIQIVSKQTTGDEIPASARDRVLHLLNAWWLFYNIPKLVLSDNWVKLPDGAARIFPISYAAAVWTLVN